jgi:hypothetical protein
MKDVMAYISNDMQVGAKEPPNQEELAALSLEVVCLEWALDDLRDRLSLARSRGAGPETGIPASQPCTQGRSLADIDAALRARGIQ